MNRRNFVGMGLAGLAQRATSEKPNIVLILADDLGYGDLSCYGAKKVQTPLSMASRNRACYLLTRMLPRRFVPLPAYGILTGRYCWRTQLKYDCLFGHDPLLIEEDRMTVASLLKSAGYSTAAVGKWHLGFGKDYPD